jgi:dipeptidyl aminopeptidase/acylaminoacyl peptidase
VTTIAPYGSWRSVITTELLVERVVGLSNPVVAGDAVLWVESRPTEGGRQVIVCRDAHGSTRDVLPAGFSARSMVHEYGGLCYAVHGGVVYFSNFSDQRLHRVDLADGAAPPQPITPEPATPLADRYADPVVTGDGAWILCVRERHNGAAAVDVVNEIVAVPTDGSAPPRVIVSGHDFFSAPRLSPDGRRLAWLSWDHPQMPWDGTELWEAEIDAACALHHTRKVAGAVDESVNQPRYGPDGTLYCASDRTGWWRLYADAGGTGHAVGADADLDEAEFSGPDWAFGQSTYVVMDDGSVVAAWVQRGVAHLGVLGAGDGNGSPTVTAIASPFTAVSTLVRGPRPSTVIALAASPTEGPALVEIRIPGGEVSVLKRNRDVTVDAVHISVPTAVEFPTEHDRTAHALFYAPVNPDFRAPVDERPPLIVMSHGGPTGSTSAVLNYAVQFWTSRGFAVVDVNYGGSTGYGRAYRERLNGQWGIVDVDDCVNAARWLASQGLVDGVRMAIRGGSAGGYTTLCALTFRDVFAAGAGHYGIADAGALARDTHKFESRYTDGLIGPWPEAEAVYEERSPIFHTDLLSTPLILFQGLEDRVVPPNQAEMMAAALDAKGIPHALIEYEGEQHGFRRAENIMRTASAELSFYGQVLGFAPADDEDPVVIVHAGAIRHGHR